MRVLLLGATGYLGRHCVQALVAHKHVVTLYVRNLSKLQTVISPALLDLVDSIVEGDATDSAGIKRALIDHNIEGIIDVAGNQVVLGDYSLPKIAKAVSDSAIAVGKERGKPLRAWITSGFLILQRPGSIYLLQDYFPRITMDQHQATRDVITPIPLTDLRWSIMAIAKMLPLKVDVGLKPLEAPIAHNMLISAGVPPAWKDSWFKMIPFIGDALNILFVIMYYYCTKYTRVADFLAEDLEKDGNEWIGKSVGLKQQDWKKDV